MKYNPFKMWGSWVGLFIAMIITVLVTYFCAGFQAFGTFSCRTEFWSILNYNNSTLKFIIIVISGFFVGWGIHSLIKYLLTR